MTVTLLDDEDVPPVVRCKDCHRVLTDPASQLRPDGPQGPDCWEREHGTPLSRLSRRTPAVPDQQPALPLDLPEDAMDAEPVVFDAVALVGQLRREAAEVARLRALIDRILDYSAFTAAQQAEYRRRADDREA